MKYLIVFLAFSGFIMGCAQHANEPQIELAELQLQLENIQKYIDSGTCTGESGCSYIAVGKKPCGGPAGYLAFPASLDVDILEDMVNAYTKAQGAYNVQTGAASDCSIVNPPNLLGCEDGKCFIIE